MSSGSVYLGSPGGLPPWQLCEVTEKLNCLGPDKKVC